MVLLVAVTNSNIGKFDVSVDDDTTVGDVRAIVAATLDYDDVDDAGLRLSFRGIPLLDDNQLVIATLRPVEQERVFVHVPVRSGKAADVGTTSSSLRHQSLNAQREEEAQRQQAKAMEPMIAALANNPGFIEGMMQSQPQLQQLLRNNPEAAKELSNPETLKSLMMAQLDPDARRRMYTAMEMQLAQVGAMPGGAAAIERAMNSVTRDLDRPGKRTQADLSEISDERARPDPNKSANTEPLPNPWAPQPQAAHAQPARLAGEFSASRNPFAQLPAQLPAFSGGGISSGIPDTAALPSPYPGYDYSRQLRVLMEDMGFEDEALCREALRRSNGDIDGAVNYIASQTP